MLSVSLHDMGGRRGGETDLLVDEVDNDHSERRKNPGNPIGESDVDWDPVVGGAGVEGIDGVAREESCV